MKKRNLEQQLYIYQIWSLIFTIVISLGISLGYMVHHEYNNIDQNITNVARSFSNNSEVQEMLEHHTKISDEFMEKLDNFIAQSSNIDSIVLCDTDSLRYYHKNHDLIGQSYSMQMYSDDILKGASPYFITAPGTLGDQRQIYMPVYTDNGEISGFVMVSILTTNITHITKQFLSVFFILALTLIGIAIIFTERFNYKLRDTLLGYRPETFSRMFVERTEVINTLEEGIFAVNKDGYIIMMNDAAQAILDLPKGHYDGANIMDIYPESQINDVLKSAVAEYNVNLLLHGKNIMINRIPIVEKNRILGAVSILRNKTDVTRMAEELTGANYMMDTLRAFNHEFKNKLHAILGYIEMGESDAARDLILNTHMVSTRAVSQVTKNIPIPGIAALIIGKIMLASESGISLKLKPDTTCDAAHSPFPSDVYMTILGNLIQNSIEALNIIKDGERIIEVGIYIWASGCILSVDDTGSGMSDAIQDKIFENGFSTKGQGRGNGMPLIKDIVDRYQGSLDIVSEEGAGTSITVTLSGENPN